jgi:hypothetical protein
MSNTPYRATLLAVAAVTLAACAADPVEWDDTAERHAIVPPPSAAHPDPARLADSILRETLRTSVPPALTLPPEVLNAAGPACPTSLRVAAGRGGERAAAWWAQRENGTAVLLSSRSADGGATWSAPARIDTLDVAPTRCERHAPSVALDTVNGYAHVAYSIVAPEGTGVFYAHRMGPTLPFEGPFVIVYGDHVVPTSVASEGDRVAIAYEDPNTGGRPYISLALSRTGGHSWDERFAVSSNAESAERPGVALRGGAVSVGWMARATPRRLAPTDDRNAGTGGGMVVVRVGRLR